MVIALNHSVRIPPFANFNSSSATALPIFFTIDFPTLKVVVEPLSTTLLLMTFNLLASMSLYTKLWKFKAVSKKMWSLRRKPSVSSFMNSKSVSFNLSSNDVISWKRFKSPSSSSPTPSIILFLLPCLGVSFPSCWYMMYRASCSVTRSSLIFGLLSYIKG